MSAENDPENPNSVANTLDATPSATTGTLSAEMDEPPESWIGRTIDGKYEIESVLGVGGMGMVFQARRVLIGDAIALKVLFPRCMESELQRRLFRDEGIAAARLNHRNVVTVFDAEMSADDDSAYIAMELLDGESFKGVLRAKAPMDVRDVLPLMIQVCDGLTSAHRAQIIHRDLKPDNIFLERRKDGSTRVKLVDFGIAAMIDLDYGDEPRRLLGTLRYMAPEQCRGDTVDPRADLYALGVVLYEALTRRRATGKSIEAVMKQVPTPPSEILPEERRLPPKLETLLMKLLQKEPGDRPTTARVVRDALQGILEDINGTIVERPTFSGPALEQPPTEQRSEPNSKVMAALGFGVIIAIGLLVWSFL